MRAPFEQVADLWIGFPREIERHAQPAGDAVEIGVGKMELYKLPDGLVVPTAPQVDDRRSRLRQVVPGRDGNDFRVDHAQYEPIGRIADVLRTGEPRPAIDQRLALGKQGLGRGLSIGKRSEHPERGDQHDRCSGGGHRYPGALRSASRSPTKKKDRRQTIAARGADLQVGPRRFSLVSGNIADRHQNEVFFCQMLLRCHCAYPSGPRRPHCTQMNGPETRP